MHTFIFLWNAKMALCCHLTISLLSKSKLKGASNYCILQNKREKQMFVCDLSQFCVCQLRAACHFRSRSTLSRISNLTTIFPLFTLFL